MSFEDGISSHSQTPRPENPFTTGSISEKGIQDIDTVATAFKKRADAQQQAIVDFYNSSHKNMPITISDLRGMSSIERGQIMGQYINAGQAEAFADTYDDELEDYEPLVGAPAPELHQTLKEVAPDRTDTIH